MITTMFLLFLWIRVVGGASYMDSIYSFFEKHDQTKEADNDNKQVTTTTTMSNQRLPSIKNKNNNDNDLSLLRRFASSPSAIGNTIRNYSMSVVPSKHTFDDYLVKKMMDSVSRLGNMSQLLLIGDSFFFKFPKASTKWSTLESKYGTINLGAPGERTEHILNRFKNGRMLKNITTVRPMVLAMIGTSNVIVGDQPNSILNGIDSVLTLLTKHLNLPWFVLVSILPRSTAPYNRAIIEVNQGLAVKYRTTMNKNVQFVDFTDVFQHQNNGSLKEHMYMFDQIHPSAEGQDTIMHNLQTFFDRLSTLSDVPMVPSKFP